jgi:hypothetical protein
MGKADRQERKLSGFGEQFDPALQGGVPTRGVRFAGNPLASFTCSPSRLRHVSLASAILRHPDRQALVFFSGFGSSGALDRGVRGRHDVIGQCFGLSAPSFGLVFRFRSLRFFPSRSWILPRILKGRPGGTEAEKAVMHD